MRTKHLYILAATVFSALFVSCQEKEEYQYGADGPMVAIEKSDKLPEILSNQEHTIHLNVKCNTKWKAESMNEWIVLQQKEGELHSSIDAKLLANQGEKRRGFIRVYNTIGTQKADTIEIIQGKGEGVTTSNDHVEIASSVKEAISGDEFVTVPFTIKANTKWLVNTDENATWVSAITKFGEGDGDGVLSVAPNPELTERSATITLESMEHPDVKSSFTLTQKGRKPVLFVKDPQNKEIILSEGDLSFNFEIRADGHYTISECPDWITIQGDNFEGNHKFIGMINKTLSGNNTGLIKFKSTDFNGLEDQLQITYNVIPEGRYKDSLALVAFYKATGGEHWTIDHPWDFSQPIVKGFDDNTNSNWEGISVDLINGEWRVVDIQFMSNNNLTGTLPNEIGWLTELQKLKLQGNHLTGSLPASMSKLTKLTHILLGRNRFTGILPDFTNNHFEHFKIEFNRFTGPFPVYIAQTKGIKMDFKYNNFDEETCIGEWKADSWRIGSFINPQRRVDGDNSTKYKLWACDDPKKPENIHP